MGATKPTLVIMAAGMGSRFGGLKQIAPVDDAGHIFIDYSMYDAYRAGFRDVVCIINPKNEKDFAEHFRNVPMNITFVHQTLDKIPEGFIVPAERIKPWGTGHAIICAKDAIKDSFVVINADDFYGSGSFKLMYDFLTSIVDETQYAMVGYKIENTLTESGYVSRGICTVQDGYLKNIKEITKIKPAPGGAVYTDNETDFTFLPDGTIISMNMWGFGNSMLGELENRFKVFFPNKIEANPLMCEYHLSTVVCELLDENLATVQVIPTIDKWYGVTHPQDMSSVQAYLASLKEIGVYPKQLWART